MVRKSGKSNKDKNDVSSMNKQEEIGGHPGKMGIENDDLAISNKNVSYNGNISCEDTPGHKVTDSEDDFYIVPPVTSVPKVKKEEKIAPKAPTAVQKKKCKNKNQKIAQKPPTNDIRVPYIYKPNIGQLQAKKQEESNQKIESSKPKDLQKSYEKVKKIQKQKIVKRCENKQISIDYGNNQHTKDYQQTVKDALSNIKSFTLLSDSKYVSEEKQSSLTNSNDASSNISQDTNTTLHEEVLDSFQKCIRDYTSYRKYERHHEVGDSSRLEDVEEEPTDDINDSMASQSKAVQCQTFEKSDSPIQPEITDSMTNQSLELILCNVEDGVSEENSVVEYLPNEKHGKENMDELVKDLDLNSNTSSIPDISHTNVIVEEVGVKDIPLDVERNNGQKQVMKSKKEGMLQRVDKCVDETEQFLPLSENVEILSEGSHQKVALQEDIIDKETNSCADKTIQHHSALNKDGYLVKEFDETNETLKNKQSNIKCNFKKGHKKVLNAKKLIEKSSTVDKFGEFCMRHFLAEILKGSSVNINDPFEKTNFDEMFQLFINTEMKKRLRESNKDETKSLGNGNVRDINRNILMFNKINKLKDQKADGADNSSSDLSEIVHFDESDNETITSPSTCNSDEDWEDLTNDSESSEYENINNNNNNVPINKDENNPNDILKLKESWEKTFYESINKIKANSNEDTFQNNSSKREEKVPSKEVEKVVFNNYTQTPEEIFEYLYKLKQTRNMLGIKKFRLKKKIIKQMYSSNNINDGNSLIILINVSKFKKSISKEIRISKVENKESTKVKESGILNIKKPEVRQNVEYQTIYSPEFEHIARLIDIRRKNPDLIFINNRFPRVDCGLKATLGSGNSIGENLILKEKSLAGRFDKYKNILLMEICCAYVVTLGRFLDRKIPLDTDEVIVTAFAEVLVDKNLRKSVSSEEAQNEFIGAVHALMSEDRKDLCIPSHQDFQKYVSERKKENPTVAINSPFDPEYYNNIDSLVHYVVFLATSKSFCPYTVLDLKYLCVALIDREGYVPDGLMLNHLEKLRVLGYIIHISNFQIGLYFQRYGHSTTATVVVENLDSLEMTDEEYRMFVDAIRMPTSNMTCFFAIGKALKYFDDFPWGNLMLMCKKEWHNYTFAAISLNGISSMEKQCAYTTNYNNYPQLAYAAKEILTKIGNDEVLNFYPGWSDLLVKHKKDIDEMIRQYSRHKLNDTVKQVELKTLNAREARERDFLFNLLNGYVYAKLFDATDFDCDKTSFRTTTLNSEQEERQWMVLKRSRTVLKLRLFSRPKSKTYFELLEEVEAMIKTVEQKSHFKFLS